MLRMLSSNPILDFNELLEVQEKRGGVHII